jgi:glyoxylase-like metal-dependent hydrolase (beta-lactamase superfamily II)
LPDLHTVNAYAIVGGEGLALVDPGWATPDNEAALTAALRALGFQPADVGAILVTHSHWDHYTQAIRWQQKYDIPVHLGREEHHSIDAYAGDGEPYPFQIAQLRRAGAADIAAQVEVLPWEPYEVGMPFGPPDVWLAGDESIDCGGRPIRTVATPGHTRGHTVFEDTADRLLFTGDHILPRITPAVGFERQPEPLPLRSYLGSLQKFLDRPDASMLPAHGAVTDSVHERVAELLAHHRQRLELVSDLIAGGAETAAEVARRMRWTRHERTIDDLGALHGMTAIMEVIAHLDLLVWQGQLVKEESALTTYRPA